MGIATFNFDASVFAQFFHSRMCAVVIPRALADCIGPRDVGRGRGSGKAFVRRQGAEIHSTDPLWQMRRRCAFDWRSPDPVKRDGSEIRVFECYDCGHQTLRTVKG